MLQSKAHIRDFGGQKERDIVVDLDVDARIMLKWTLKDGVGGQWSGFGWL